MNRKDFIKKGVGAFLSGHLPNHPSDVKGQMNATERQNPQDIIAIPKSGASISPVGNYHLRPFKGAVDYSIPIGLPSARQLSPELALTYNISVGNGVFGPGWDLSLQEIKRKNSKAVPLYNGGDAFILSGHDDLVAVNSHEKRLSGMEFDVIIFRPRVEDLYARIEHWKIKDTPEDSRNFWRVITKDNVTHLFGYSAGAKLVNPSNKYAYSWKLEFSYDARGNYVYYSYQKDAELNLFLKDIFYANTTMFTYASLEDVLAKLKNIDFQLCAYKISFDYGQYDESLKETGTWSERPDPFSAFRSGFEIRTKILCRKILVFFLDNQTYVAAKSLDFSYALDKVSHQNFLVSACFIGYKKIKDDYTKESYPPYRSAIPLLCLVHRNFNPSLLSCRVQQGRPITMPGWISMPMACPLLSKTTHRREHGLFGRTVEI